MLNILLIEDDLMVQHVHRLMLSKLGCNVDVVATATDALIKIKENINYHLIFVDIGLPDMSGFDLIKIIRALTHHSRPDLTIIVITGYSGFNETQACLEAGACEVIYKPVLHNTFREIICNLKSTQKIERIN